MKASSFLRSLLVRFTLVAGLVFAFSGSSQVVKADSAPPGLVLWNKLDSDAEVLNSEFGPDLGFYMPGDCQNLSCDDWADIRGNPAYIPGVFGNALTLDLGPYSSGQRVHNAVLRNANNYISAEQGAVEIWFQETADPFPAVYGIYRLFDGAWGLGDVIGLWVQGENIYIESPARLVFSMAGSCYVTSKEDGKPGVLMSTYNNTWIHVAAAWDRKGIAGTPETLRLYLNGVEVAATGCTDWPTDFSRSIDIGGGNDTDIAGKFAVDNLKVWNYAKTDYSDRFVEGFALLQEVKVDIKPGDSTNPINLKSNGVIPVAILSTSIFAAESVLPTSVTFGPNEASSESSTLEDVNGDDRLDLVLHFLTQQTGIQHSDTQACLTGQTRSGTPIQGCDNIHIVP